MTRNSRWQRRRQSHTRASHRARKLLFQPLEGRRVFVIGAFDVPDPIEPISSYDGVVDLGGGGGLLYTGRHILTAAHVNDARAPGYHARFEIQSNEFIGVPVKSLVNAPGWTGDFSDGRDIGIMELEWVAPFPAQRYDIYRDNDELFTAPNVVGYGLTGIGTSEPVELNGITANRIADGNKRTGRNRWEADGSLLSNEVMRVSVEGNPTGGTFRVRMGDQTTDPIPHDATAAEISAELDQLPGVAIDRVAGGPLSVRPVFVTFEGSVSLDDDWSTLGGGLTGGDDPRVRLRSFTRGDTFNLPNGTSFLYDMDNGTTTNDAFGMIYGIAGLGQGAAEGYAAGGDSGSPYFLDGKMVGIVSGGTSFNVNPPDYDPVDLALFLGSFGDIGIVTRVSAFESWIDSVLDDNYDLWLNMNVQPDAGDFSEDVIRARVVGNEIELVVNGQVYHRDLLSRIDSLKITGSIDPDQIILDPSLLAVADFPIEINGGSNEFFSNQLIVDRSTASGDLIAMVTDDTIGGGGDDTFLLEGASLSFSNIDELEVLTGSGADVVDSRLASLRLIARGGDGNDQFHDGPGFQQFYGGDDNDTYYFYDSEIPGLDVVIESPDEGTDTIDASAMSPAPQVDPPGIDGELSFSSETTFRIVEGAADIEFSQNIVPYLAPIEGPVFGVTFQELTYSADFVGIGSLMTHTVDIDWQDPPPVTEAGTIVQPDHTGVASGQHTYTTQGTRTITFTLTNNDGMSVHGSTEVLIDNVGVGPDPNRPGKTALFVGGTAGHNFFQLTSFTPGITTMIDGVNEGTFAPTGGIYVYAGPGSDVVQVVAPITLPVEVEAGAGHDVVYGGGGNDILLGQDGSDVLYGMNGDDRLDGGADLDQLFGLEGNDTLLGGSGNDYLYGGNGNDHLQGNAGLDYLYGEFGNDLLLGGEDNDWLDAGFGNDIAIGGLGKDTLYGMDGEDLLMGGTTVHDGNEAALLALWTSWRSAASFDVRVAAIGGLINAGTVSDDTAGEIIVGSGGRDWFVDYSLNDWLVDYYAFMGDKRNT